VELKTHSKFGGDALATVLNNTQESNLVEVVRHIQLGKAVGKFLSNGRDKMEVPCGESAMVLTMAWTSGHDLLSKSVPNLSQM
jgi:hypothetical protein